MEHSQEAAATVEAWYERMSQGDADGAAALLVDDPETFAIGTQRIGPGPDEWIASMGEMTQLGAQWSSGALRAWEAGGAGFAVDEPTVRLPDGMAVAMRMTAFLVRTQDRFRIFNMHFSWSVPDEVAFEQIGAWRAALGLAPA
jgi:ketosteroid isomerase-like protein